MNKIQSVILFIFCINQVLVFGQQIDLNIGDSYLYEPTLYILKIKNNTSADFTVMVSPHFDWKDYPSFLVNNEAKKETGICINQSYPKVSSEPFNYEPIKIAPDSTYIIKGLLYPMVDINGKQSALDNASKYHIKAVVRINESVNYYSNEVKLSFRKVNNKANELALDWLNSLKIPCYFLELLNIPNTKVLYSANYKNRNNTSVFNPSINGLNLPTNDYDNYILEHFPTSRYAYWAKLHKAFALIYRDFYQAKEINNDWYNKSTEALVYLIDLLKCNDKTLLHCTMKVLSDLKTNFLYYKQITIGNAIELHQETMSEEYINLNNKINQVEIDLKQKLQLLSQ